MLGEKTMATIEDKEKVIEVLKKGPYKYYKVNVRRATVSETQYLVKHKVSDGEFNAWDYTSDLYLGCDGPENWTIWDEDPCADEYDPEIDTVDECDEYGEMV